VKYRSMARNLGRLRVLFVSSEIFPLAKTGGLADVCGSLPVALTRTGDIDMVLMLPGYDSVFEAIRDWDEIATLPDLPGGPARLLMGTMPDSRLQVVALDQPPAFRSRGGLYIDENGKEWADNPQRFAALCHAAIEMAMGRVLPFWTADIIHCNDWHTALIPVLLTAQPGRRPRTIFTIHNLAFQGLYPVEVLSQIGLPEGCFSIDGLEFFGRVSFLKGGLNFADKLTTVSPSYAEEITSAGFGMGLEGVLARRNADLVGILNGIDETVWNPGADRSLPCSYDAENPTNKEFCKAELQRSWGLEPDGTAPLLVFAARLEAQKMADTLLEILPDLLARPRVQIAVIGRGAPDLQDGFAATAARSPGRIAARIGYREEWAHLLLAGGDILLHGARFEPCGLTPMYAMRYGAVPIVRSVGGLKDTVTAVDDASLAAGSASGFHFEAPTAAALLDAVDHALSLFSQKQRWRKIQQVGMRKDFSWRLASARYRQLYDELAAATA
jgi:starch synthase